MAHTPNSEPHKRKRDTDDVGAQSGRPHHASSHGASGFINYLPSSSGSPLGLIHGDVDTFGEIIGLIGEYESKL